MAMDKKKNREELAARIFVERVAHENTASMTPANAADHAKCAYTCADAFITETESQVVAEPEPETPTEE